MRSSVKKCPTIVCRRGVWRGLGLSIKSLPLRRKEPEDENLPVFLCLFPTGASSLANGRANTKKGVLQAHRFISARAPPARREGMRNEMRPNPDAGGNGGAPISPFLQKKRLKLMINHLSLFSFECLV